MVLLKWHQNKYYLPRKYRLALQVAWLLLIFMGIVGALLTKSDSFLTYSASWFALSLLILCTGIYEEVRTWKSVRKLHISLKLLLGCWYV